MSLRRASVLFASLLALLASGCGTTGGNSASNFKGPQKDVAQVIDDLQKAGAKRDSDTICNQLLASALQTKIQQASKKSCSSAVKESLKDVDAFSLDVVKNGIAINGTTATARVQSKAHNDDRTDTLQLVKEDQRARGKTTQVWKISALGG